MILKTSHAHFSIIDRDVILDKIQSIIGSYGNNAPNIYLLHGDFTDDEMMFALILKNLSDRQISLDKKLINYIIKRIDRSYGKIFEFIYKIDEKSLKKKKSIDFKIIKEVLEE